MPVTVVALSELHHAKGHDQFARLDHVESLKPHPFQTMTQLLHQWPDKLGLPINPFRTEAAA